MEQLRDPQGRFYAPRRKTQKLRLRIDPLDFQVLRFEARAKNMSIPDVLADLIDDAYAIFATKGTPPVIYEDEESLSVWYDFRVDQATRSMLYEMAECAGVNASLMIRSIVWGYAETH